MKKWEKLSDHPLSPKQKMTRDQYEAMRDEWLKQQFDRWAMFVAGFCTALVLIVAFLLFENRINF